MKRRRLSGDMLQTPEPRVIDARRRDRGGVAASNHPLSQRGDTLSSSGLDALSSFGDRSDYSSPEVDLPLRTEEESAEETSSISEVLLLGMKAILAATRFAPRTRATRVALAVAGWAMVAADEFAKEDAEEASEQIRALQLQVEQQQHKLMHQHRLLQQLQRQMHLIHEASAGNR